MLYYALPALVLSGILYLTFIAGGIQTSGFMHLQIGFTSTGLVDWLKQWTWQWGIMPILALFGFIFLRKQLSLNGQALVAACFLLFILGNLMLFQPIAWDNSKIFVWAYLGCSVMAAAVITWLWQQRTAAKICALTLLPLLSLTGIIDLISLQQINAHQLLGSSTADIQLGAQIRNSTSPTAVFLTSPDNNHLVMTWADRPILMGFTGWIANFGFPYQERWQAMNQMYQGGIQADILLKKYQISYVVIGPSENYTFSSNEAYFASRFPLVFSNQSYRIYDTRSLFE